MDDLWKRLSEAGLPIGSSGGPSGSPPDFRDFPRALRCLVDDGRLDAWQATAVLAWLGAWRSHWPTHYRRIWGLQGDAMFERLRREADDWGRYLKLRRIALERLSRIL